MNNLKEETWEADMLDAVNDNHRRAVQEAGRHSEPEKPAIPMWVCLLWTILMAAASAACLIYAAG